MTTMNRLTTIWLMTKHASACSIMMYSILSSLRIQNVSRYGMLATVVCRMSTETSQLKILLASALMSERGNSSLVINEAVSIA